MDYHGLKLLWSWMIDIDALAETRLHIECKLKIIKVLEALSIKNRTVLDECKLLIVVKKWAKLNEHDDQRVNKNDDETDSFSSSPSKLSITIILFFFNVDKKALNALIKSGFPTQSFK